MREQIIEGGSFPLKGPMTIRSNIIFRHCNFTAIEHMKYLMIVDYRKVLVHAPKFEYCRFNGCGIVEKAFVVMPDCWVDALGNGNFYEGFTVGEIEQFKLNEPLRISE